MHQDVKMNQAVVEHAFNPSTQRGREAGGSLWVWGQPGLQSKFQESQSYTEWQVSCVYVCV